MDKLLSGLSKKIGSSGEAVVVIPKHLQIETINGVCSAHCRMCTIDSWSRKSQKMSIETFEGIMGKFVRYIDRIQYVTLHGCGEPLLDRELPEKIRIAKHLGFHGTGFASNCTHLDGGMSLKLLEAGLDTIICSVDGVKKETHESIRIGTDYDEIVANIKRFIDLRDAGKWPTRVMIRFIRQPCNKDEWPMFRKRWARVLDVRRQDSVVCFDVHNWGGNAPCNESSAPLSCGSLICSDLFERMLIYSNGNVALCCADDNGFNRMGNLIKDDPVDVYNNDIFRRYRMMMKQGRIGELKHCKTCSIPYARHLKE